MKARFLFPSKFRYLGFLMAIPGFIIGYLALYKHYDIPWLHVRITNRNTIFSPVNDNFSITLALSLVIIGLLLIAFSKVKKEDELTRTIRLNALYWAILVNVYIYAFICIYSLVYTTDLYGDDAYYWFFARYNLFTPLLIFIAIFYYLLYRRKNEFTVKPIRYLPNKPYSFIGKLVSIILLLMFITGYFFQNPIMGGSHILLPIALALWAYSKEKIEDEYISSIRLEAMQVAVYVNYAILLIINIVVYGWSFSFMQVIFFFTIPFIFVIWFQFKLYRNKQQAAKSILS
jgi:hypothetical protein